jgi:AraC-like DNA-binding protein
MPLTKLKKLTSASFENGALEGYSVKQPTPGLVLLRSDQCTDIMHTIYEPCVCLILQGKKETRLQNSELEFGEGESLIVSHTLPVRSRITQASAQEPYLAVVFNIDIGLMRSLQNEIALASKDAGQISSMQADNAEEDFIFALERYLNICKNKVELELLGPLLKKEIHFRPLTDKHGSMLRKMLDPNSYASQINKAIMYLFEHFRTTVSMSELASVAGMSESAFYKHFKAVTDTSPLQYQKELRLIEARRLLREQNLSVSTVAFDVGYESPTQFSREYQRKYNVSPRQEKTLAIP